MPRIHEGIVQPSALHSRLGTKEPANKEKERQST
jgi:hypothetical protein